MFQLKTVDPQILDLEQYVHFCSPLHLALHSLGIGPNDEVILPTLTYVATANSVAYVGTKPVVVDSDKDTWNINPEKIIKKTVFHIGEG